MKKKINNQQREEKQLSLNFTTENSFNKSKGVIISFNQFNNYSENNIVRDIIENTKSY